MARSVVGDDDDDAMSSPDPLNEPLDVTWTVPPSSRGSKATTTRSQTSRRFLALGDTPRKRTFALDVGNEKSPQKILVTVEAGSDGRDRTGVSRRLFQSSPSMAGTVRRPKGGRTTTKVPLKGLSDDEVADAATPKPRGRPRRSGTPAATTAKGRKRVDTPARKAPRARSRASTVESLASDAGVEGPEEEVATPRPGSRVPRSTKRKATSSPRKLVPSEETQPKKRGRPRRTEGAGHEQDEEDVWMANLSEEEDVRSEDDIVQEAPRGEQGDDEDYNDLGDRDHYSDDAGSEAASHADTVAAGEEFTMISIGSLPSMQANSSMMGPRQEEDNDSARQSGNNRDQQETRDDTGEGLGLSMFPTSAPRIWHRSPRRTLVQKKKASLLYEDSFSDIPEAVLAAAATPGRRQEVVVEDMQPSIEPPVIHAQPPSEPSSRMLTPPDDETNSPRPASSPPVPDEDRRRVRTGSNETPLLDKISPRDERRPAEPAVPSAEPVGRPSLSPIVRAGRALQLITSDSPSPRARESVLRSPFRVKSQSPAASSVPPAQDPPTSAQPQERSWADALAPLSHLKKMVMNGAQAFSSSTPSRGALFGKSGAAPEPVVASTGSSSPRAMGVERQEDGAEDDIWAVEAQRPTPRPEEVGNSRVYNHGQLWEREPSSASQLAVDENENVTQTTKKLDLSSFFSSPADLPDMQAPSSFGLFRALDARTSENKLNDVDLFSPVRRDFPGRPTGILVDTTNQQPSSSRPSFVHVPKKHTFMRQSLFSVPGPALPPRREPVDDEYEEESSLFMHQVGPLRPLPDRAVSPTKSCLRSPLKPKTPGRVVDFDEDVMSPLAQARARAQRKRLSSVSSVSTNQNNRGPEHTTENNSSSHVSPPEGPTTADPARRSLFAAFSQHAPKENTTAASFTTSTRTAPASWTRAHWIRLDQLLQERRRVGALPFQLAHGGVASRRAAARHALLGKHVSTTSGETMELQPFHLDVVAAFAAEEPCVGGVAWDETVLARRLFSLVLGEQRRRDGKVPLRT